MGLLYFFYHPFLIVYLVVPLGVNCLIRCLLYSLNKEDADCNTVLDFVNIQFLMSLMELMEIL